MKGVMTAGKPAGCCHVTEGCWCYLHIWKVHISVISCYCGRMVTAHAAGSGDLKIEEKYAGGMVGLGRC